MAWRDTIQATAGLLCYWPLDDAFGASSYAALAGGTAFTPGSGTAAPIAGCLGWTDGTAVQFAGTDGAGTAASLDLTAHNKLIFEMLLWVPGPYGTDDSVTYEFGPDSPASSVGAFFTFHSSNGATILPFHKGDVGFSGNTYSRPTLGRWRHVVSVHDKSLSSGETALYIDGVLQTPAASPYNSDNTNNFGNLVLYIASRAVSSLFTKCKIQHLAVYGNAATAATVASHFASLPGQPSSSYALVCDGDSIFTDFNRSGTATLPQLLCGRFVRASEYNYAVPGQRADETAADAATQIDTTFSGLSAYTRRIVIPNFGINDCFAGEDAATVQGDIQGYHEARRSAGWETIACTMTKASSVTGAAETVRQTVNDWLRSNWRTFSNGLADFDRNGHFADTSDTTYFTDGTHWTVAGAVVAAQVAAAAIAPSYPALPLLSGFGFGFGM